MNIPLYARLVGYRTLRVPTPHTAAFLDLCRRHGFVYYGYREGDNKFFTYARICAFFCKINRLSVAK